MRRRLTAVGLGLLVSVLASACGGSDRFADPDPPVGAALLPDIVPTPPEYVQLFRKASENGQGKGKQVKWQLAFSSTLVNVGDGDFVLRARRDPSNAWHVEQIVEHSTSGADVSSTPARMVWGGDGHDHWHILRVATNRLVRLGGDGKPVPGKSWIDTKVGFCFYDHKKRLEKGPDEPRYVHEGCGDRDDVRIGMGLSPGWEDIYPFTLPGQTIDITNLPDGTYRMWVTADEGRWFRDRDRTNNVTWVDLEFFTRGANRFAEVVRTGPQPPRAPA
jgi:hypothetical protein